MYSLPIKIFQGTANPIQIMVMNRDQRPVNLTGYALQVNIEDPYHRVTVASYAITYYDQTTGLGNFVIDQATVDALEQRLYKLSVKQINENTDVPSIVYLDDNYGALIDLEVLPAYYSKTAPAPTQQESVLDGGVIGLT